MEDFESSDDATDTGGNSVSSSSEVSEKFKEGVKKRGAKAKKSQKDEKKAKKYDFILSSFLIKIILDKKYDDLLALLMACLDKGYPSNFLLGVFSLAYLDISKSIRKESNKKIFEFDYVSKEYIEFSDSVINDKVRNRINYWVEDMIDVVLLEGSEMTTKKLIELFEKEKKVIDDYIVGIFVFFFRSINITISDEKAFNYVDFILGELIKSYRNYYFSLNLEEIEE